MSIMVIASQYFFTFTHPIKSLQPTLMNYSHKFLISCSLCFGATVLSAMAQRAGEVDLAVPDLGGPSRGSAIITKLGSYLPAVATFYRKTEEELGALVLKDRDLQADRFGKLHYACKAPLANAPTSGNAGTNALLSYPASQTFLLHSKPGLSRVIYLDFTGHTTSGTPWNQAYAAGGDIVSPAYDIDNVPTAFSTAELANIQEIWKQISEDYAPWDVDVTTEEPPLETLRKTTVQDTAYGIRVVIGGYSAQWLGANAGGVAYIGSYSWNTDTPAFVFAGELGNGYPKYVAEAISHEVGHSVGLEHDGATDGTEYYAGLNGWAPIMGNSYYATVTQFSRGEYTAANNPEDDTAVINTYIPRSADLAGDDILSAVALSGPSVSATGLIQSSIDADLYRFTSGAGTLSVSANPASPDANLDIRLSLYDGLGNLLTSVSPTTLGASLSSVVTAGTYYLSVEGTGSGTTATGYSDYGSLGQFVLTGTIPASINQAPLAVTSQTTPKTGLAPLTVNFSSAGSSDPEGGALAYDWDFGNGIHSNLANPQYIYQSAGTYSASLVVVDNAGLSQTSAVSIVVTAPPQVNQPPLAVTAQSTPLSGIAPLPVNFSSAGSSDPEGGVLSYLWNFGNGITSTLANPAYTFTTPGTYNATLTVRDAGGLSHTSNLTIKAINGATILYVSNIAMSKIVSSSNGTYAKAVVTVKDATGAVRANATVTGVWSGLTSSTSNVKTNSTGSASFSSAYSKTNGTFTFKVTGITLSGTTYEPVRNIETTDFIVK